MRICIVIDGRVRDVLTLDAPEGAIVSAIAHPSAERGWEWTGSEMREPSGDVDLGVPGSVTMRRARLALLAAGLLDVVQQTIDALPEPQRTAARIEWDHSSEVHRHHGLVQQMAPALGLSSAQLDALFVAAAAIP